jgi:hypothetical protein
MFYDLSRSSTTQVGGWDAVDMPFEPVRARKILVQHGLSSIITMARGLDEPVQFRLVWHRDPTETAEMIKKETVYRAKNPRLALTSDVEDPGLKTRYVRREELGSGQFVIVYKATNFDSGKHMAIKRVGRPAEERPHRALKREIEILFQISHVSIL